MLLKILLESLQQTVDAGANQSVISQLVAYRNNFKSPVFIRAINTHSALLHRYITTLMPYEQQAKVKQIFSALSLCSQYYFEPQYKEHILQKFVVENNLTGVIVALELGVDINTTVSYVHDLSHSQIIQGLMQLLVCKLPRAWYDNWHHCTPLVLASLLGHYDVVKYLVEQGARLDCETKHHNTALDWASKRNHYKIEYYLRNKGAPRNTTSDRGELEAIGAWS